MPPTFLIFVGALVYVPTVLLLLSVGILLLAPVRTRLLGKRIIYATLATAPALALSCAVVGVGLLVAAIAASIMARPWTQNGQVEHPAVAAFLGFAFLGLLLLGTALVAASVLAAGRVGWRMASGLSFWEVVERDPLLRRFDPWYGSLRARVPRA
jgi:hypothetical protein